MIANNSQVSRPITAGWVFDLEDGYQKLLRGPRSHPQPVNALVFELIEEEIDGAMVPLPAVRELEVVLSPGGYYLFFGRELLPEGGRRVLALVSGRRYRLRIRGPVYQTMEFDVPYPMPERRIVPGNPDPWAAFSRSLEPAATYPFPGAAGYRPAEDPLGCGGSITPSATGATRLRGSLLHPDGSGREGATVIVTGRSNEYKVGPDGQWVLWFRPGDTAITGLHTVTITLPDGSNASVAGVCVARGHETSLPATALRGQVLRRGLGVTGATIAIAGFSGTVTTAADGAWWYYFLPNQGNVTNVNVTATLPDGASLSQGTLIRSRGTVVVPSFVFP